MEEGIFQRPGRGAPARRDGLDDFLGCFLGGAAGDALGAAVEFDGLAEILRRFGPEGILDPAEAYGRAGAITDDTQMLLFTAEGLLRAHHRFLARGICSVPGVVWRAYQRWLETQGGTAAAVPAKAAGRGGRPVRGTGRDRGAASDGWLVSVAGLHRRRAPGATCLEALRSGRMGTPSERLNDSKGCGGVMRIAPVGLVAADPFGLGCEIAALTHGHPNGWAAAGFFALLVSELVGGLCLADAVGAALAAVERVPAAAETAAAVRRARGLAARSRGSPEDVERLGGGWVAEEAVAIAVYCALRAEDFAHGVRLAVNHSGDSDSTGSMAGNLLGLVHGAGAIPAPWLDGLELRAEIEELATDFWRHLAARPPARCDRGGCGQWEKYPGS